jgi:DNA-nicking Smr family endonuclease
MIKVDFHGLTVAEAKRKTEELINECRVNGYVKCCEFITGQGVIKEALKRLLDKYEIEYSDTWGNEGSFKTDIE